MAKRKDRSASMSRSISYSSSFRISGSRTEVLAAVRCSERSRSTVALNDDWAGDMESELKGVSGRGEDLLRCLGLPTGEGPCEAREKMPLGVFGPVSDGLLVR